MTLKSLSNVNVLKKNKTFIWLTFYDSFKGKLFEMDIFFNQNEDLKLTNKATNYTILAWAFLVYLKG